jgi:hypothetical protein
MELEQPRPEWMIARPEWMIARAESMIARAVRVNQNQRWLMCRMCQFM